MELDSTYKRGRVQDGKGPSSKRYVIASHPPPSGWWLQMIAAAAATLPLLAHISHGPTTKFSIVKAFLRASLSLSRSAMRLACGIIHPHTHTHTHTHTDTHRHDGGKGDGHHEQAGKGGLPMIGAMRVDLTVCWGLLWERCEKKSHR